MTTSFGPNGLRLRTFHFTKTYIPTGKTFTEPCEFESLAAFKAALVRWNKIGDGLWFYEAAVLTT